MEMKESLLVAIAFHYSEDRLKWLHQVIDNLLTYDCPIVIIVDTNVENLDLGKPVVVHSHTDLEHPFHLTWVHRQHFKNNIDKYDNFFYVEDDVLVPFENYKNYLENFKLLWPSAVPSFVRIEQKDEEDYISDIPQIQNLEIVNVGAKQFHSFKFPYSYHAFWIMPNKELKETMKDNFVQLSDGREFAASYTAWELRKPPMVQIEKNLVSKKCYSYHLPNNYALGDGPNAKIKPENIFNK